MHTQTHTQIQNVSAFWTGIILQEETEGMLCQKPHGGQTHDN